LSRSFSATERNILNPSSASSIRLPARVGALSKRWKSRLTPPYAATTKPMSGEVAPQMKTIPAISAARKRPAMREPPIAPLQRATTPPPPYRTVRHAAAARDRSIAVPNVHAVSQTPMKSIAARISPRSSCRAATRSPSAESTAPAAR